MFRSKFTLYLERRDEEARRRDAERAEEAHKRDAERAEEARKRTLEARKRDEEGKARWARLEQLGEETREFNREILLRNEKVYTTVIAEMEEGRRQIRANTQAVLSVLDRLNGSS